MESTWRPSHLVLISYRVGESRSLRSTPMPAGDTLHGAMKRAGEGEAEAWGGRTAFNIILASNLIRFVFSYLAHVSIYCYLSARAAAFYSCVIMPQGGDQKYARQCNAPLCMRLWSCEYSSRRGRATIQNFGLKKKARVQTRQAFHILCWIKTFFFPPPCVGCQNTATTIRRINWFNILSYISGTAAAMCSIWRLMSSTFQRLRFDNPHPELSKAKNEDNEQSSERLNHLNQNRVCVSRRTKIAAVYKKKVNKIKKVGAET